MKYPKAKRITLIVVLIMTVVVVGGAVAYNRHSSKNTQVTANTTPEDSHESTTTPHEGHHKIFGESLLTQQGPTDAPIGDVPSEASLLIANNTKLTNALASARPATNNSEPGIKMSTATTAGARIAVTTKGNYEIPLEHEEDTICLLQRSQVDPNDTNAVYYQAGGSSCIQLVSTDSPTHVDIKQIGFGASQLTCEPQSACTASTIAFK